MIAFLRAFAVLSALIPLLGCALYPVPEDVTGVTTHDIVRQIRCETRESIRDVILEQLGRNAETTPPNPVAFRLLKEYGADREKMDDFSPNLFSEYPLILDVYKTIYSVGIAYNFDLKMNEENDIGTTIDVLGGWAPKFNLEFNADLNRGRTNERSFTITDTFEGLITRLGHPSQGIRYCDNHIVEENYIYPIAGHIGVITLVKTYLNLTIFDGLSAPKDKASPGSPGGPPSIADQLTFTTTIDAGLTPKVTFSPVGHTLEMSDAGFSGKVSRVDTHTVTVGLALNSKAIADVTSLQNYVFGTRIPPTVVGSKGSVAAGGRVILANTLTANANTNAEGLAALAADQLKSRQIQLVRNR